MVLSSTPRAYAVAGVRGRASGWLPRSRFASRISGRHRTRKIVACRAVRRPPSFSGLGMVSILTIDLDKGLWEVDADAVMTDAQTVYGSAGHLYVATQRWSDAQTQPTEPPTTSTLIHRFDVSDPDRTTYEASGVVPGYLLNQYSLSEQDGDLRVASTSEPVWWQGAQQSDSESYVTVLRRQGSTLAPIGRVSGLGKGQRIYSVRFIGDVGYVVTFRQVDPLYTIGLADPTAPKVLGQLELLGYSAYLHPIADDLLLGVGQDATPEGRTKGVQVSLFAVGDPAHPRLLAQHALDTASSSQVEFDSHAFLYWAPRQLVVLPLQVFDTGDGTSSSPGFTGAIALKVDALGDRRDRPRRARSGRRLRPADQPLDRHRRPAADGVRRRRAGERARRLRADRVGGVPTAGGDVVAGCRLAGLAPRLRHARAYSIIAGRELPGSRLLAVVPLRELPGIRPAFRTRSQAVRAPRALTTPPDAPTAAHSLPSMML